MSSTGQPCLDPASASANNPWHSARTIPVLVELLPFFCCSKSARSVCLQWPSVFRVGLLTALLSSTTDLLCPTAKPRRAVFDRTTAARSLRRLAVESRESRGWCNPSGRDVLPRNYRLLLRLSPLLSPVLGRPRYRSGPLLSQYKLCTVILFSSDRWTAKHFCTEVHQKLIESRDCAGQRYKPTVWRCSTSYYNIEFVPREPRRPSAKRKVELTVDVYW
eukprot:1780836-Rhodomonas_salina.3